MDFQVHKKLGLERTDMCTLELEQLDQFSVIIICVGRSNATDIDKLKFDYDILLKTVSIFNLIYFKTLIFFFLRLLMACRNPHTLY